MDTPALVILTLVIAWTVLYGFYRLAIYVVELRDREAGARRYEIRGRELAASPSRRKHAHSARSASAKSGV